MNDEQRNLQVRRIILLEGCVNLLVVGLKVFVGLATQSLAILADAIHSLADVANNVLAWFIVGVAGKPPDENHPYGHRKFETLAVFGLATLLVVMAIELVLHAVRTGARPVDSEPWALTLMIGVLVVNIALATWQRYWARRLDADILHADASHTFGDVLTSVAVIAGWQFAALGYLWLDRATAVAVAALVFFLAWKLYRRVIPVLVDEASIEPETLSAAVAGIDGVVKVGRVRSRWVGSRAVADVIVFVHPELTTLRAHRIADEIEHRLHEDLDVKDATVHIEPLPPDEAADDRDVRTNT